MRLYVETMNAVVIEVSGDGRVSLENEDWSEPTLQERRAIIYAAKHEIAALTELAEMLDQSKPSWSRKSLEWTHVVQAFSSTCQV